LSLLLPGIPLTRSRQTMKIATLAIGLVIKTLVMAAAISSPLAAQLIRTGPYASNLTPASDHSLGLKQVLLIRTQFPDLANSKTQADCQTVMEQVRQHYVASSYGRTDMNVTVTAVAYMMPHPSIYYVTQSNRDAILTALMNDAVAAASADYPVDQTGGSYDFVGNYFPYIAPGPGHAGGGTYGSFGTKWFWVSGAGSNQGMSPGLIGHEMGHAYGARHASLWQTSDGNPVSATGKIAEYGDFYDPMGAAPYSQPYGDFNPWVKWHFGWIDDAQVAIVTAPGTYQFRIFRFDSAASTGLLSVKVPRGDGSNYWIGIRRNFVKNPLEMTGAYIIWGYDVLFHDSALIDCNTPGSKISDSALQVGQTLNDAPHGITITPLAIGGSDPNQYMDVQVTKQPTSMVTVQTNPVGLAFSVDGTTYNATQSFSWDPGSSHTIATTSPQSGGTGVRYVWKNWSGGGAISHSVAPTTNKTFTANFGTQYYLTMSHNTGGTVTPASGWKASGATISISATPSSLYHFTNWTGTGTGSYSGTNNPASITMGGPITETATFTHN